MTKQVIRALLKNTLAQIDKTSKYHDTYIDHLIEQCVNSVYYQVYAQSPRALGQYTKRYTTQAIASGGTANRYYHTLTVSLVPMPDKRGGVRSIVSSVDTDVYFVPVTDQELMLMDEAQADGLTTATPIVVYYIVRPDLIEFKNMTATIGAGTLTLDLLVCFTDLADTDEVPLPLGKNVEVIKMALEILGVVPPKDLLDNNSDVK
jgi:hypothetical protein